MNDFFPVFNSLSYEFNVRETTKGTVSSTYMIEIVLSCWQIYFCSKCIFIFLNKENASKFYFDWGLTVHHLVTLNRQNWQELQLCRWKLRHRQIQQLHKKSVTEPGTELRFLVLDCLSALAKLAFWRDHDGIKKQQHCRPWHRWESLVPEMVWDCHFTVPSDPAHLRCSRCPGCGVG